MQTNEPTRAKLEAQLGDRINALLSATRALSERSAAQFHEGLQPASFHIARWLHAFGPAKPSVIAEAVGMDRSSTSTLLRRMLALGLISQTPSPDDRRSVIVDLTAAGTARVTAVLQERGAEYFSRLQDWSTDDLRELERLLGKLTGA
ncbi:MarR family winged helix-turn-helix transcriptional regulator [Microbacterium sp. ZW T5_45]|uniref:MarR family winged helix-turn-helix transcriptional regulator n=1 Tax=Microbacterium sp. ZW T5_45 TaxID=3378080 RepID=UPI003854C274